VEEEGRNLLANSPKNDSLSTAEPCALYYFPEIPNTAKPASKPASPAPTSFTSGSFEEQDDHLVQDGNQQDQQDPEQIQSLIEEAFNKGLEQGRAEMEAVHEEQIKNTVTAFETSIQEMHRVRQKDIGCMESEIVRLSLAIAKKIVGYETEHRTVIQHVVEQAIGKVNDTRQLVIKINPKDLDTVQAIEQDLLPADDLGTVFRIEADEGIKRGGCIIETKLGDIDARIDKQIKIIEERLIAQIPKPVVQK
jgi:flagellar biosynthesis/type III secretory pathway protein FliH